jgi:hypothetical protein
MRRRTAVPAILAAGALLLALPGAAGAGGFATLGLSSLPDGTAPGRPWHATLTILQHGRTPMSGLRPRVRIASADGRTVRTFAARAAAKPGTYTVDVVFPSAGRWTYAIDDGFSQTHTFAPVAIGASAAVPALPSPAASGGSSGAAGAASGGSGSSGAAGAAPAGSRSSGAAGAAPGGNTSAVRGDGRGGNVVAALGAALAAGLLAAGATAFVVRRCTPATPPSAAPAAR